MDLTSKQNAKQKPKQEKKNRGRMPSKRSINLVTVGQKSIHPLVAAPSILLIVALAALFGKFAVADRLLTLHSIQQQAEELQSRLTVETAAIEAFGDLTDEYAHYTYSGMTQEELTRVNRIEVVDLIIRVVLPYVSVNSWSVSGNIISLNLSGTTIGEVNQLTQRLEAESMVNYCTVITASGNIPNVTVTATVTVYLNAIGERGEISSIPTTPTT